MKHIFIVVLLLFVVQGCADDTSSSSKPNYGVVSDFEKPCAAGSQCESQKCIEMNGGMGCSRYCYKEGDCPDGFYCAPENSATSDSSELLGLCRPVATDVICDSCTTDTQCSEIAGKCLKFGDSQVRFCLMDCRLDGCPDGFSCKDLEGSKYCLPDSNDCSCNTLKEGNTLSCEQSNEYGTCSGIKTCMGETGWTACNAKMPGPEVCDGADNNCDGNIDEGVLGTAQNCSYCGDVCQGNGITGTSAVCIEGECGVACDYDEGYFDANTNSQDGCECHDDTSGAPSADDAVSLGDKSACDFGLTFATNLIPSDINSTAHADYYRFRYDNVWNCSQELEVILRVPSASKTHVLCVSSGNNTDESTWSCKDVNPGTSVSVSPYDNDGTYYVKVSLKNTGEPNCSPYTLNICDGNGCP